MSAAARESFTKAELVRLMGIFSLNSLFPTFFLLGERIAFNTDSHGYLSYAYKLADIGLLPAATKLREWGDWEAAYPVARPGANFGYEAQAYVIFVVPVIFMAYFLFQHHRNAIRWLYLPVAIVSVAGLVFSLSRTGLFAFVLCILLFTRSKHKVTVVVAGGLLVGGLTLAIPDNYFLQRYTGQTHDAYPMSEKFVQIYNAFRVTFDNPFHIITGNAGLAESSEAGFNNPHNQFLADMMLKGVLSGVLGFAMFPAFLKRLRLSLRPAEEAADGYEEMGRIIRICILSMLIQCFSTAALENTNTAIMLWVPLFFLLQITREDRWYKVVWR